MTRWQDTDATRTELDSMFGEEIGKLVEGLTKISQLDLVSRRTKQAENIRKLLLAISDDVRVLIVKLADSSSQYAYLALCAGTQAPSHCAGKPSISTHLLPSAWGCRIFARSWKVFPSNMSIPKPMKPSMSGSKRCAKRNKTIISEIEGELEKTFLEKGLKASVRGREKKAYSIFRKMQRQNIGFEQLSDIYAFRVLVEDVEACYRTLGIVHTIWPCVPGRFKDYVSTPKPNDYQSIHTTVIGPGRQRVELQIRTHQMHQFAEYGVAAHALYKDVTRQDQRWTLSGSSGQGQQCLFMAAPDG